MNNLEIVNKINSLGGSNLLSMTLEPDYIPGSKFTIHPKEFPMFEMNNIKVPEDDGSITYQYNSKGFRSDEFRHGKDIGTNKIVFAGCSEGTGLGGNINQSWPGIVFNGIKDELNPDGFYNLSVDNFGFQKIIMNCLSYVKEYGSPDMFIVLFPDVPRVTKWVNDNYTVDWHNPYLLDIPENLEAFMNSLVEFISHIHLFEQYCKSKGIKLIWSIWSNKENEIFKIINIFENFVPFDYSIALNETELVDKVVKRDGHQGEYAHTVWAKNFIKYLIGDKHD